MSSSKLLYVDAANYTGNFFGYRTPWNLSSARKKVKKFCDAASRSGWTLVAFLDQAIMTEEAMQKWRTRREREVRLGRRDVPQGALRLVGDMLAECGVNVRYSTEADCDDTNAFHAQVDGASILSQDRDFLRYSGATYPLYKDYMIKKGRLILIKQDGTRKSSWRTLGPPPETGPCNPFRDCVEDNTYVRGSPSPLVGLGSLHIHVRPLRLALYARLGIEAVEEEFPVRVDKKCIWDKQVVHPDEACADLLLSAPDAVEYFNQQRPEGASDIDWYKHQFALRAVVAEICCTATGSTLLETLSPLMDSVVIPHNVSNARKKKQGGKQKQHANNLNPTKKEDKDSQMRAAEAPDKKKKQKKAISHYMAWRKTQKTGETNKEKRERYLTLFPEKINRQAKDKTDGELSPGPSAPVDAEGLSLAA